MVNEVIRNPKFWIGLLIAIMGFAIWIFIGRTGNNFVITILGVFMVLIGGAIINKVGKQAREKQQ